MTKTLTCSQCGDQKNTEDKDYPWCPDCNNLMQPQNRQAAAKTVWYEVSFRVKLKVREPVDDRESMGLFLRFLNVIMRAWRIHNIKVADVANIIVKKAA